MRILTLLARHGVDRYPGAVDELEALFAHQLPDVSHDLIVIDSALRPDHEQQVSSRQMLLGSTNAHWEFSAWDRGLHYAGHTIQDYDWVHLATSAFRALDLDHLRHSVSPILRAFAGRGAALGHLDSCAEPVFLYGMQSQSWLRSSWMFLAPRDVRRLGSMVAVPDAVDLFSGRADDPFRADAPLSGNFRDHILSWLTGGSPALDRRWHSQFRLTPETLAYFEAKTLAILNEHMLSIRLRAQGCTLVDVTWLATRRLTRVTPTVDPELIPSWQWQIAARQLALSEGASTTVRAALVAGECSEIARAKGKRAGRRFLWRAVAIDPRLLARRPVLGAIRRLHLRAA